MVGYTRRSGLLIAGAFCSFLFGPAYGQTQTTQPASLSTAAFPLSLRDALARVLDSNPTLQGQSFALSAADARRAQAALRPSYEISGEAEDFFGTDRMSALGQSQVTLQLSTVVELGNKRANRIATAERERDLLLTEFDAEKLDVIAEVARRFIRVVAAQREISLAERAVALASETRKAVTQRVNAGAGNAAEQRNADIAVVRAELELGRARSSLSQARESLAATWGGDTAGSVDAVAELFNLPTLEPLVALQELAEKNPSLTRFASERRLNEARLRLAETRAQPDITVGGGVRRIQELRSNAFVLNFSMPLASSKRAVPYASEARSNLAVVDYKERAARTELKATLTSFYLEAEQRATELQQLRDRAIPLAENARELTQSSFNAGRFSLLELLNAQQQLVSLQRAAIEAAVAYHNALVEIERLTARPIISQTSN